MLRRILTYFFVASTLILASCIDEIDLENFGEENFNPSLVVEATLSDQLELQKVYLSRSDIRTDLATDTVYNPFIPLGLGERETVLFERNAQVQVRVDGGSSIIFQETEPGTYVSESPFAVATNSSYELLIQTSDGASYRSDAMTLTGKSEITNIYAERMTNEFGIEGVMIYVDAQQIEGETENYRYTFDETYQIIAPLWDDEDFLLTDYDPCAFPVTYNLEIVPREVQNRVCYNTVPSRSIVQNNASASTSSGIINRFPVHFINRDDFVLSHRYSINVKQWVQSPVAYSYYQALSSFSRTGNIFSQIQPGALRANVVREGDPDEVVLGQFEVASVSHMRLFFNRDDYFPGEDLPAYPINCSIHSSPESHASFCVGGLLGNDCPQSIIERVNQGTISYVGRNNANIGTCPGPYVYVARICGDCTLLGSNVIPEFWEE